MVSDRFEKLVIPEKGRPYFTVLFRKRVVEKQGKPERYFRGKVYISNVVQLSDEEEAELHEMEVRRLLRGFTK